MSVLINTLTSAEKGRQNELKPGAAVISPAELVLEPLSIVDAASAAKVRQQSENDRNDNQKASANIFVANQSAKKSTSAVALLMTGSVGALIIWLGLQGYQYMHKLHITDVVVKPAYSMTPTTELKGTVPLSGRSIESQPGAVQGSVVPVAETKANARLGLLPESNIPRGAPDRSSALIAGSSSADAKSDSGKQVSVKKSISSRADEYDDLYDSNAGESNKAVPIKLVGRTPAASVDPTLLAAYQAYSRGDDAAAQMQYRQVLQGDVRNVDALLGMAAIALRQVRYADANGWYRKVLEIEPRNAVALSAMASLQINTESAGPASGTVDYAGTESRIKSMLIQQPEAANLYAALGNLYAAQNQWPLAQAAYFNASRYAPDSVDYAFNLAVSLDQLNKSSLALAQYQRAQYLLDNPENNSGDLSNGSAVSHLDKAQLKARIQTLQH